MEKENVNGGVSKSGASTFIKGAAILGIAAIFVKILGAVFRIPLGNMIGDTGMGYYQTAYPIYNFILVISSAGIPTSIAKIISEKYAVGDVRGADRVFNVTMKAMIIVGLVMSVLLMAGAYPLTSYLQNSKAAISILAIAPSVFFVSVMSVYRGYFQGRQRMQAYASSQIVEQFIRVVLGLSLAYFLLNKGLEYSAAGATFGASAGGFLGLIIITFMYRKEKAKEKLDLLHEGKHHAESDRKILKDLLTIAVPITIGSSIMPVMSLFDLGVVLRRLQAIGYTEALANDLYGQLTGYAQTLVNLPQIVTAAIAISIVPAISHFVKIRDKVNTDHTVETGLRLSLIIGLPCAVGLSIMSYDIMSLLYPMQPDILKNTGEILFILGFGIAFLSFFQVSTGILQGIGHQKVPVVNLFAGAVFKLVLSYVLVGIPSLNIKGAAISTVVAFGVAATLNYMTMTRFYGVKVSLSKVFIKPIIDTVAMAVAVKAALAVLAGLLPHALVTLIAMGFGVAVYAVMLFATDTLTDDDLALMPKGDKLRKLKKILSFRRR